MTTKYGDFVAPVFNCRGEPYQERKKVGDRDKGLAFAAPVAKRGKLNDACFDKARILFVGEKYVDPSRRTLQQRQKHVETPFRCPQPMKQSSGLGDYYGTLGGKLEYIAERPAASKTKGSILEQKPNLYTSPGKKGSYGYIKTTLSERAGAGGVLGEYRYVADPVGRRGGEKVAPSTQTPFVPARPPPKGGYGYAKTNVGNTAAGVAGEYAYVELGSGPPRAAVRHLETPFVPPRVARKGHNCTLGEYPEHLADPDHVLWQARCQAKKLEMSALAASSPWRPSSVPKKGATRSIVKMNV